MNQFEDIFGGYFDAYKNTSKFKDDCMLDVMLRRNEFESNLDKMWKIYSSGNTRQIVEYQKQVNEIKRCGLKVLRNSLGKHKIVVK